MRQVLAIFMIISLVSAPVAFAAKASKEENVGVGSGAVVGALAGGPVGFIIGAAIGAKIGDKMHDKNASIETLAGTLEQSRDNVALLQKDVRELHGDIDTLSVELQRFQDVDRPQLLRLMQAGIAMDLLFRTDEHVLADTTGARLAELAVAVAAMPDIQVQLDGFADERGDSQYNLELSGKRVEFVRKQLISAGIHPSRIRIAAHGEAPAQDQSADSYALERRVSLKLYISPGQSLLSAVN